MKPNVIGPLDNVYARPHNIIVHDDLFDPIVTKYIEKTLAPYPMSYGHQTYGGKQDNNRFFGRIFFWDGWQEDFNGRNMPGPVDFVSYYLLNWSCKLVHEKASYIDIHRYILNGQAVGQDTTIHIDDATDPTKWTFIYYVNDSDAGTVFYTNMEEEQAFMKVQAKKGRMVCFPSSYAHRAEAPTLEGTKKGWRQTLTSILKIHTPQNNELLLPQDKTLDYTWRVV